VYASDVGFEKPSNSRNRLRPCVSANIFVESCNYVVAMRCQPLMSLRDSGKRRAINRAPRSWRRRS
jgi:hypothetical protein